MIIKDNIPKQLLQENPNIEKFIAIIEKLQEIKESGKLEFSRSYSPYTTFTIEEVRKFVDDFGMFYNVEHTRKSLECLYKNKDKIFSGKGRLEILQLVFNCFYPDCQIDLVEAPDFYPLISKIDFNLMQLPNGEMIDEELNQNTKKIPTILGKDQSYYTKTITFALTNCGMDLTIIFFTKKLICNFLPMYDECSVIIGSGEIHSYNYSFNLSFDS